jgi:hypothetical protein
VGSDLIIVKGQPGDAEAIKQALADVVVSDRSSRQTRADLGRQWR